MKTQYRSLSTEEWKEVINKLKDREEIYMFILRSLANSQQISYYSIAAFNKQLVDEQKHPGSANNPYIGHITQVMNSILDDKLHYKETAWYIWHTTDKAWVLGWDSFLNLKKAFKEVKL